MEALGVRETVNPEFDSAQVFAEKLVMQGVKGIVPLSRDIKIAEIPVPASLVGKPDSIFTINHDYEVEVIAVTVFCSLLICPSSRKARNARSVSDVPLRQ
jgi:Trk K+ transport system NAD-binding subunit